MDERPKMKNITVAVPPIYNDNLEKLVNCGVIPSKSEGYRRAIYRFLKKEVEISKIMGYGNQ